MSVYKKGAGLIRVVYKSNLKTAPKKVSVIGKYYPFNDGLDAYQSFEVEGLPATPTEKEFLEGNPDRLSYYVPSDVTDIIPPLGVLFPNCTVYVVGNTEEVVSGLPDADAVAIVPNTLKSSYEADPVYSTYQNLTFNSWILQNETTIPFVGNTTLTASFVRLFYENAGGIASTVGKIIVPPDYMDFETGVFDLIFALFENCEEIEYGDIKVPSAYQEVEYIESSGTQAINSAYSLLSSNLKIETTIFTPSMPSSEQRVVDNIPSIDSKRFNLGLYSGYVFGFNAGNSSVISATYSGEQTLDITMVYDYASSTKTLTVNGSSTSSAYQSEINSALNIWVFGGDPGARFVGKLYFCKLYDNGTLVRDFVPCYRKADGEIGLYDAVNDVFYTNQGTGTFAKGADVIHTIERPTLSTATIYYDENTSHTLTPEIVQATLTKYPEFASAEKAVVPEWFTEYQSGSIQAIQNAFEDWEILETCYEAGNVDIEKNGDIMAKILSLNKTLDEALVYARTWVPSKSTNDQNLIIVPPCTFTGVDCREWMNGCSNLVFISKMSMPNVGILKTSFEQNKLIEANFEFGNGYCDGYQWLVSSTLKRLSMSFPNGGGNTMARSFYAPNLEKLIAMGVTSNVDVSSSLYTRQALVDLFNSLGTPSTTQTITIGATNLAKLTAEDIAIATAKNWQVQ